MNEQVSRLISTVENMQVQIDSLTISIAASIESAMTKFGESIESVGQTAMDSTSEAISGMTNKMGTFGSTIEESLSSYNEQIVKAGEDTRTAIGTVNVSIQKSGDDLHESFSSLNGTINKAGEGVKESFEGMNGHICEAGEKVTEAFDSLNGCVYQASDSVAGSLADFKLSVDGTAIELNEAVGELHGAINQATGEMVTMAKAKLDTEAQEIAGQLSLAASSIQQFMQKTSDASNDDSNQKVA
jgi:hypothetical protein